MSPNPPKPAPRSRLAAEDVVALFPNKLPPPIDEAVLTDFLPPLKEVLAGFAVPPKRDEPPDEVAFAAFPTNILAPPDGVAFSGLVPPPNRLAPVEGFSCFGPPPNKPATEVFVVLGVGLAPNMLGPEVLGVVVFRFDPNILEGVVAGFPNKPDPDAKPEPLGAAVLDVPEKRLVPALLLPGVED